MPHCWDIHWAALLESGRNLLGDINVLWISGSCYPDRQRIKSNDFNRHSNPPIGKRFKRLKMIAARHLKAAY